MVSEGTGTLDCCDGVYPEVDDAGPVAFGGSGGNGTGEDGAVTFELFSCISRGADGVASGAGGMFIVVGCDVVPVTVRMGTGGTAGLLSTDGVVD
jgi:hypothetical protein